MSDAREHFRTLRVLPRTGTHGPVAQGIGPYDWVRRGEGKWHRIESVIIRFWRPEDLDRYGMTPLAIATVSTPCGYAWPLADEALEGGVETPTGRNRCFRCVGTSRTPWATERWSYLARRMAEAPSP